MEKTPGLSRELQLSLGEKIREHYSIFMQSLPLSLVALSRKVSRLPKAAPQPSKPFVEIFANNSDGGFDPETVGILTEAFDKGWKDLSYLETNPATRSALALCLIALLNNGERDPSRLATKAVLKLIAPRAPLET